MKSSKKPVNQKNLLRRGAACEGMLGLKLLLKQKHMAYKGKKREPGAKEFIQFRWLLRLPNGSLPLRASDSAGPFCCHHPMRNLRLNSNANHVRLLVKKAVVFSADAAAFMWSVSFSSCRPWSLCGPYVSE
jgi:hypothetical protein